MTRRNASSSTRRETLRPLQKQAAPATDVDRALRALDKIVDDNYSGSLRHRFVCAFITRLHRMRIPLVTLATPEGVDAATAIVWALLADGWDRYELTECTSQTLPQSWLRALTIVGGKAPAKTSLDLSSRPRFTNNIRIR